MFKNYFYIIWRNLIQNTSYSFLNIAGLTVGLTTFMLIYLWVWDELSYDQFHPNADRLYRVVGNQYYANNEPFPVAVTPAPLGPYLEDNIPDIMATTRLVNVKPLVRNGNQGFYENGLIADPSLLDLFTFPLLKGDAENALSNVENILITEKLAKKFFGEEDPMGKTLTLRENDHFIVSGMLRDIPKNSHLDFDFVIGFDFFKRFGPDHLNNWGNNSYYTYLLLHENSQKAAVDTKIRDIINQHSDQLNTELFLQPLSDIHLYSQFTADIGKHGDILYIYIFSVVGIFILLIACINSMNLSTARSTQRAKEIGVRKVIGAHRLQLIGQFLMESLIFSMMALILALLLVELLLPVFNDLSGKSIVFDPLASNMLLMLAVITLSTGMMAGMYPALLLSSFKPVSALKGTLKTGKGALVFRKILVVTQFCFSILLIMGTLVIYNQLSFIRDKRLGFDKENTLCFTIPNMPPNQYATFKNELLANAALEVTFASDNLTYITGSTSGFDWEGKEPGKDVLMYGLSVDYDFIQTFNIALKEGRDFSRDIATDATAVILNEEALKQMGLEHPIHKRWGQDGRIIGVVKDFHFKPVYEKIEPLVMYVGPKNYSHVFAKLPSENIQQGVAAVEIVFKKFSPDRPFEYSFLNDDFDRLYRSEQRIGKIFNYFAFVAIFISCLGLYGLVLFSTAQRTKEIGIRKVFGASVGAIVVMVLKDFLVLIVLACIIAIPPAYFFMQKWLESFVYRISIGADIFLTAGGILLMISWLTVSLRSIKAATANPINSLRSE